MSQTSTSLARSQHRLLQEDDTSFRPPKNTLPTALRQNGPEACDICFVTCFFMLLTSLRGRCGATTVDGTTTSCGREASGKRWLFAQSDAFMEHGGSCGRGPCPRSYVQRASVQARHAPAESRSLHKRFVGERRPAASASTATACVHAVHPTLAPLLRRGAIG